MGNLVFFDGKYGRMPSICQKHQGWNNITRRHWEIPYGIFLEIEKKMSVRVCSGMSENGHSGQMCLHARSPFRTVRKGLGDVALSGRVCHQGWVLKPFQAQFQSLCQWLRMQTLSYCLCHASFSKIMFPILLTL